jgi:hypothetical protein
MAEGLVTFPTNDLSPDVALFGELLGLLADAGGGNLTLDPAWFGKVGDELAQIPRRVPQLVATVQALLGTPAAGGPQVFTGAQWFAIPNPLDGSPTGFYLVTPAADAAAGTVGLGAMQPFALGSLTIDAYGYVPLFSLSTTADPQFVATTQAAGVGVEASLADGGTFQPQGGATFTGMRLQASVWLADQDPSMALYFDGLQNAGSTPGEYDSLAALLQEIGVVGGWIASVILSASYWLNSYVGSSSATVGQVLQSACLLTQDGNDAWELNTQYLQSSAGSVQTIAVNFLLGILDTLASATTPLIPISVGDADSGIYVVKEDAGNGASDYGVRLVVQDATLGGLGAGAAGDQGGGGGGGDGAPAVPGPSLSVQLGKWLSGETDASSWVARSLGTGEPPAPGASIFLLQAAGPQCGQTPPQLSFNPRFELSSVGFDVTGAQGQALFDVDGYTLAGAELRVYLAQDDSGAITFGAGASLDGVGVPLGPAFGAATADSGGNPAAQSLLSSGAGQGGEAQASGDQDPVNPAFGMSAAWVQGGEFVVQLYDASGNPASVVTIPIQRALGPLYCDTLGIGWVQDTTSSANDRLSLLFSGGVKLTVLDVDVQGLSIGIPITDPGNLSGYDLDLQGLGLTFDAGGVELSGAFVKVPANPPTIPCAEYDGEVLVKAGPYTLMALGSYAYIPATGASGGYASLFLYGVFDGELGGPEFFFVTGIAAGFGYNRGLVLPDMSGVPDFPLVAAASDPTKLGATQNADGSWTMPDPSSVVTLLGGIVPPQRGEYWFAAGVRFTSFDLINSTALLTVEFGQELEIALLGLSWVSLPPPSAPGASAPSNPFAYAELGMEVVLLPSQGEFSATAVLTSNSFVLDPACKLTGGFAFCVWFGSSPYAGQWVLTLGGYHPSFDPPPYFPQVPRLGFNWPMGGDVTVSGDAYFALTPSAVMAGGGLQVLFHSGNLQAWFTAQMDALVQWAPFHYELTISVSVGASYKLNLLFCTKTIKVELGASLALWGPPTGGSVHVSWYIISFTVGFGADRSSAPPPLEWTNDSGTGFAQTLLPHATSSSSSGSAVATAMMADAAPASAAQTVSPSGVLSISCSAGLLSTLSKGTETIWVVSPGQFTFTAQTTIPATAVEIVTDDNGDTTTHAADGYTTVSIRPMGQTLSASVVTLTLLSVDDGTTQNLAADFAFDWLTQDVPAAKWDDPLAPGTEPDMNKLLPGRLMGITNATGAQPVLTPASPVLAVDMTTAFVDDPVDPDPYYLPLSASEPPAGPTPAEDPDALQVIAGTLTAPSVADARDSLYAALQLLGVDPGSNGTVAQLAADPGAYLYGPPLVLPTVTSSSD